MSLHPQFHVTVELTSTRSAEFDGLVDGPQAEFLARLDQVGSEIVEEDLRSLFGTSLDSIKVTATHSLVQREQAAA